MTSQPQSPLPQSFPMHELAQIERALSAAQDYVATLRQRHDLLSTELDRLTRPAPSVPRIVGPGFCYRGEMVTTWSAIDIHVGVLRRLWTDFPDKRDAMAQAMRARVFAYVCGAHTPRTAPGKVRGLGYEVQPRSGRRLGVRYEFESDAHRHFVARRGSGSWAQVARRRTADLARHTNLAEAGPAEPRGAIQSVAAQTTFKKG